MTNGLESIDTVNINVLNCPGGLSSDEDVDGLDIVQYVIARRSLNQEAFTSDFGKTNCRQK